MTAAERLMARGFERLRAQQTRSSFTLSDSSGTIGTFTGVTNQTNNSTLAAPGGIENERSLTVVADREQFTTAGVTPTAGMSITFQGSRYVIEDIPSSADEALIRLDCVEPTRK